MGTTDRLRMADLLGSLSMIADMGYGLPPQSAVKSCLVGTALARKLGLPESEVHDAFFAGLLMHIGCISFSHETAVIFGNELEVTRAVQMTNLGDPEDFVTTLVPEATRNMDAAESERFGEALAEHGDTFGQRFDSASCEVARETARRIGLGESTQRTIWELAEAWAGIGAPQGLKGEEIAAAARVARLASDAAFFDDIGDVSAAVDAVRRRAGTVLDPEMAEVFCSDAASLLADANVGDPRARIIEVEPEPVVEIDRTALVSLAAAFGDSIDLKTPFLQGHSKEVARLAASAGRALGLDNESMECLQVAAFLHDLGRVGVTDVVWEKPGSLTMMEWEQVRLHPYYSERVLAASPTLEPMAKIAGRHHERLDGTGYHRGCSRSDQNVMARILSAADSLSAMTQNRPHRPALSVDEAVEELKRECREGKFDAEVVEAILDVSGKKKRRTDLNPGGLSEREIEVLRLVALGNSNPEVADQLHISRRTAEHHVQHIYAKIGISSRPGMALYALEHDLLST